MNSQQNMQSIRQLQIIAGALIMGVTSFLAVVLFLAMSSDSPPSSDFSELLLALGVFSVPALAGSFIIRMMFAGKVREELRELRRAGDETAVPVSFVRSTIFSSAAAESMGLFGVTVYMLSHNTYALIAVGLSIGTMLVNFPTQSKLDSMDH